MLLVPYGRRNELLKTRKAVMVALVFVTVLLTAGVVRAVDEPVDLLAKARWEYSTDSGETFSAAVDVAQSDKTTSIIARTEFDVPEPAAVACLELTHALQPSQQFALTINDSPVTGPMDGMFYRTIPAIEANILRTGTNVLTARFTASPAQVKVNMSLMALKSEHLAFQTGPLLGAADGESFTVVCRTNMPAEVTLTGKDASASAEQLILRSHGLIHRFRAKWRQDYHYTLTAGKGRIVRTVAIKPRILDPGSSGGRLRFVVMGDSRMNVANWAKVSAAAVRSEPDLLVFGGDMVTYGRDDWQWDNEFFRPAAELFAT
ncbi:MAG: hypothetical protein HQ546_03230, partial [Planctomycetes bacterium]|nr:hypothetical protein [Planctomycetota bacterium]